MCGEGSSGIYGWKIFPFACYTDFSAVTHNINVFLLDPVFDASDSELHTKIELSCGKAL